MIIFVCLQAANNADEIRKVFKAMQLNINPDQNGLAEPTLAIYNIRTAYCVLRDPKKRSAYDKVLAKGRERERADVVIVAAASGST